MHWRWLALGAALMLGVRSESCVFSGKPTKGIRDKVDVSPIFEKGALDLTVTNSTPPSITHTQIQVNLCAALPHDGQKSTEDECPEGTLVCKTVTNEKHGDKRVTQVIPVASRAETFLPDASPLQRQKIGNQRYVLHLAGPVYDNVNQTADLHVYCSPAHREPLLRFSGAPGGRPSTLSLDILTATACRRQGNPSSRGFFGGIAHFVSFMFWLALAAFVLYLLGGIWSNYTYYGARGWDLLPNRDFWRETPYLVQETVRHAMRGPRGQGGHADYDPI